MNRNYSLFSIVPQLPPGQKKDTTCPIHSPTTYAMWKPAGIHGGKRNDFFLQNTK